MTKHQAQASRAQCLEAVAHHALAPALARVLVAFGHPDAPMVPGIREGYENAHAWVRVFHCPELKNGWLPHSYPRQIARDLRHYK